jgi:hypothetical protein
MIKKLDFDPVEDKFMQRFDENGNFVVFLSSRN